MGRPDRDFIDAEDAHYVAMEVAWANQDQDLYKYHADELLALYKELLEENFEDMGDMQLDEEPVDKQEL